MLKGRTTFTNITGTGICQPDPCGDCKNGGACERQPSGDYVCICPQGWTGKQCTVDVDECARGEFASMAYIDQYIFKFRLNS